MRPQDFINGCARCPHCYHVPDIEFLDDASSYKFALSCPCNPMVRALGRNSSEVVAEWNHKIYRTLRKAA